MSSPTRGAVVAALLLTLGSAGCASDRVPLDAPTLTAAPARECRQLLKALPDTLSGQLRRPVAPDDALGAAWGDPASTLVCGRGKPRDGAPFAFCEQVDGLDWYAPEATSADQSVPATLYLVGREPAVTLTLPPQARPPADELVALAKVLKRHTRAVQNPCQH